ncbi:MAG TPA: DUF1338 family protein [Gammaproteobacteria bacterium]|jgi:hypothetical protein|nr:DUF1338 family protein [Gammaproteobacteria bacterium]
MQKKIRQSLTQALWQHQRQTSRQIQSLEQALLPHTNLPLPIDHLAIIDLPGAQTGIPVLKEILTSIGYIERGRGYLPDKQNDFCWLAEVDSESLPVGDVLPQIVIADFRENELPQTVRAIIQKYAAQAKPFPFASLYTLLSDTKNAPLISQMIFEYITKPKWSLPTCQEFNIVSECNELLAWVLVFGSRPNHFAFSIHLMSLFPNLENFHTFLLNHTTLSINTAGGIIKGESETKIRQSATLAAPEKYPLADGTVDVRTEFLEFVWRYQIDTSLILDETILWKNYFTGFIAQQADHVIESLYTHHTSRCEILTPSLQEI